MRKLLIFVLVLGFASVANADLVFTVNGEPQPPEVFINPSDTIELDVELTAGETITAYDFTYTLSNAQAEFIPDNTVWPAPFTFAGGWLEATQPQMVHFGASVFGPDLEGPLDIAHGNEIMSGLIVHCLDPTDVTLIITANAGTIVDGQPLEGEIHRLVIHQIPEPLTLSLLGLGGLFLRRRR
jgi:hypothetical protein